MSVSKPTFLRHRQQPTKKPLRQLLLPIYDPNHYKSDQHGIPSSSRLGYFSEEWFGRISNRWEQVDLFEIETQERNDWIAYPDANLKQYLHHKALSSTSLASIVALGTRLPIQGVKAVASRLLFFEIYRRHKWQSTAQPIPDTIST